MPNKEIYNKTIEEAMKQSRKARASKAKERAAKAKKAREMSFFCPSESTRPPPLSKEQRKLEQVAKQVNFQLLQLAAGRNVQSTRY